ncbi:MAG: hypothetical protein IJA97_06895 [Clostridia bacterium]|nr:hypothetical protein [Clostridia bacterium]
MTDIHSHILPFVDDGSDSYEKSFKMLEHAVSNGVDKIILTPHFKRRAYGQNTAKVAEEFEKFRTAVKDRNIPVKLYLGQEILCDDRLYEDLKQGNLLTLNGSKYLFLEFDYFEYADIVDFAYNVKAMGYIPVIAHIERYKYLTAKALIDLKKEGALIQVNSASVTGHYGRAFKKKVLVAIKSGLVDFVATDTHYGREECLSDAYKVVKRRFGKETADKLFITNAELFNL